MDIRKIDFDKKRVFLRADLNTPLEDKKILQDYRLNAILPTIKHIKKGGGKIILATHIGRPPATTEKNYFDENLSTKILVPWFEANGHKIEYEIDLQKAIERSHQNFDTILLLENLRFFNGEKETSDTFAELLAQCADVYINDAFGLFHRNDTSITLLPKKFDENKRAHGFLVEKELEELKKLKEDPKQPFIILLGGAKVGTKIKMLDSFLEQPDKKRVRTILIGGALAKQVAKTYDFLEKAKQYDVKVLLPKEFYEDIDPETIEIFKKEIAKAKTIFSNGTMGIYEDERYAQGSKEILKAIAANTKAYKIIGGGDTVAATYAFGLEDNIDFLSTGGGATLAFLSGANLPGLLP